MAISEMVMSKWMPASMFKPGPVEMTAWEMVAGLYWIVKVCEPERDIQLLSSPKQNRIFLTKSFFKKARKVRNKIFDSSKKFTHKIYFTAFQRHMVVIIPITASLCGFLLSQKKAPELYSPGAFLF